MIAERNVRKQKDLFLDSISTSTPEQVDKLNNLINIAKDNGVEGVYVGNAASLTA